MLLRKQTSSSCLSPSEGEIYSMAVHPAYLKDFLDHPFTVNRETQDYRIQQRVLCGRFHVP